MLHRDEVVNYGVTWLIFAAECLALAWFISLAATVLATVIDFYAAVGTEAGLAIDSTIFVVILLIYAVLVFLALAGN